MKITGMMIGIGVVVLGLVVAGIAGAAGIMVAKSASAEAGKKAGADAGRKAGAAVGKLTREQMNAMAGRTR